MTSYVFPPEMPTALPVVGGDASFPVRRVYCVGRNYAAHAREMGGDPNREPPFFFCKPGDAVVAVPPDAPLEWKYPTQTALVHHEVELVVAIGKGGSDIAPERALEHVYGYALGLDMTRRDLQNEMRNAGRSWEIGKAFDRAAPIGPVHKADDVGHFDTGAIWLAVNGETKQQGDFSDLIWPVAETIAYLSRFFALQPGDLIMTGTPEGVGAVKPGDTLNFGAERLGELSLKVV